MYFPNSSKDPPDFEGMYARGVGTQKTWKHKHGSIHDLQNGQYRNNLIFEASRREDLRRGFSGRRLWTTGRMMEKRYMTSLWKKT